MEYYYAAWSVIMNALGFALMGIDKQRARRGLFRIRERTLFTVAALGGGFGSLLGMYAFRHKTRHPAFVIGMPLLVVVHIVAAFFLLR